MERKVSPRPEGAAGDDDVVVIAHEAKHWVEYYMHGGPQIGDPSPFAVDMRGRVPSEGVLVELGCGTGRDAWFFARCGIKVRAVDLCEVAIGELQKQAATYQTDRNNVPQFVVHDFTRFGEDAFAGEAVTTVYSRFTLHSIPKKSASRALSWAYRRLAPGGQLMIEARSVLDPLCGKGEKAGPDEWLDPKDKHYRRFLRVAELLAELRSYGFQINEAADVKESAGLAVFVKNGVVIDDPVVIRVCARKP